MSIKSLIKTVLLVVALPLVTPAHAVVISYRLGDNADPNDGRSDFVGPGFDNLTIGGTPSDVTILAKKTTGIVEFGDVTNVLTVDMTAETYAADEEVDFRISTLDPAFSGLLGLILPLADNSLVLDLAEPPTYTLKISGGDGSDVLTLETADPGTSTLQIDGGGGYDVLDVSEVFDALGATLFAASDASGSILLPTGLPIVTYTNIEEVRTTPIPAPATATLFLVGLAALGYRHCRADLCQR